MDYFARSLERGASKLQQLGGEETTGEILERCEENSKENGLRDSTASTWQGLKISQLKISQKNWHANLDKH